MLSYISSAILYFHMGCLLTIFFLATSAIVWIIDIEVSAEPVVNDASLQVDPIITGMNFPTSMAFIGPNDILVLEKNQGTVRRIVNGNMLDEPLLDVNVANKAERGMLGIAITKHETKDGDEPKISVFLYYTETKSKDGEDLEEGGLALGNRIYRYDLENNKLINPVLLLDLPAEPGADHQGGVVLIGPDKNVYVAMGDVNHFNEAQNMLDQKAPDGSSGILRITQDGKLVKDENNLGNVDPLNKYYAYGIRNSFGMDFDPVTGNLWDTENGINCCDEINLVEPGFNSGWAQVQGIWELNQSERTDRVRVFEQTTDIQKLVDFDGKGKYSSPEFIWNFSVAPSALRFLDSGKLGPQYWHDMFVGDVNNGYIYRFDLTKDRTGLSLTNLLQDKIADKIDELDDIVFAKGLGRITDIEVGSDGNLYILSHSWNDDPYLRSGTIFKISKLDN